MKKLIEEAPEVAKSFFSLTESVTDYGEFDKKIKELIILGIFTGTGAMRGLGTHVERAIKAGATKKEIIGAILLALPICGISNVNMAVEKALEGMQE